MKDIITELEEIRPTLSDRFHVRRIGYFGSYASGDQSIDSDLDLLVEFSEPIGWDFFALEKFLEEKLGLRIDLVTASALKDGLKESILKQVKYI